MPVNCDAVLAEFIQASPDEAANIDQQVEQIEELQATLEEQSQAIRECVTDKARDDMTAYLNGTKLPEIESLYGDPGNTPFSVVYGASYGTIGYGTGNITDWSIVDSTGNNMYSYLGVNWDSDATITGLVGDYDFGNDYITHPVGIGAAYGLEPLVDMYEQGKATLLGNKAKIEASVDVFKKYLS